MATLFTLLFLFFLGFLVWGVVSPSSLSRFSKKPMSRRESAGGFGFLAAIFFVLTGVTAPPQQNAIPAVSTPAAITSQAPAESKPAEPAKPQPTAKQVTETQTVNYTSQTVPDDSMAQGTRAVTTKGVAGVKTVTFEVTTLEDKEVSRRQIGESVTTQPINEIIKVGTKVAAPTVAQSAPKTSTQSHTNTGGVVKKSTSSICHAPGTTYYNQTKNFTGYGTLEACLNSGGRLPKR